MFSFRYTSGFVNIRRWYCRTSWAKNEGPNCCSYLYQIVMDSNFTR